MHLPLHSQRHQAPHGPPRPSRVLPVLREPWRSASSSDDDDEEKKNEVIRLEQDILSDLADSKQFFVYETKDFWRQIKTAGSAVPANALYLQKALQSQSEELTTPSANIIPPVFIHPTATVDPTAKLGPNVSIGPRVTIGAGARVKESIVLEDSEIKHDACVLLLHHWLEQPRRRLGSCRGHPNSRHAATPPASSRTASRSRASPFLARSAVSAMRSACRTVSACPSRS